MRVDVYAFIAGITAGVGSAIVLRWIYSRISRAGLWLPAMNVVRSLLNVDDRDFVSRYRELSPLLMRYLGRQALALGASTYAVAMVAVLIVPQWKQSDLRFFLPLCVGSILGMLLPRTAK
jgi:hypothetical protein